MTDEVRTVDEPHDRLTRLCAVMTEALDADPERGEAKCQIFLRDDTHSGLVLYGYDDDIEAMADLLAHLRAIFRANGKEFMIFPMAAGPS